MGVGFDRLYGLRDEGLDYLKLRWTSLRLTAVEKIAGSLSKAFGIALSLVFVLTALIFLMVALALWIGEMLGHPSLGFLITGGGFLVLGIVLFFVGKILVANSLVKHFIDMFFTYDNDYDDGYGMQR